jgi:hypothetical protein
MPLREAFLDASEFIFSGGIWIFVRDQPGALTCKDQKQQSRQQLWPPETFR